MTTGVRGDGVIVTKEQFLIAFYEELARKPDTAPSVTSMCKRLGLGRLNGRMQRVRRALLLNEGFRLNLDTNRYERTKP